VPAPRLVVFDLDGTLVDSIRDIAAAVRDAIERVAPGTRPPEQHEIHSFVGDGAATLLARSLAAAGVDRRVEEVLPLYLDAYRRRLLDTTRFYPGVVEALDAMKDRTLCVLTNKPGALSRALLAGLGASDRFARVWGGGDVPGKKPDPEGLRRLMGELAARPEATVMVGDSPVDVATGRAAGVFTVGVTFGFDPRGVVAARPDAVLGDLRDLPPLLRGRDEGTRAPGT
jgi:phosphoglycolate phosphatase